MVETIKARLLASRISEYTVYAFENLDMPGEYILCTLLPNWENGKVEVGQEGILSYRRVKAGEVWVCPRTFHENQYAYSAIYYDDFIPQTHIVDGNRVINSKVITVS